LEIILKDFSYFILEIDFISILGRDAFNNLIIFKVNYLEILFLLGTLSKDFIPVFSGKKKEIILQKNFPQPCPSRVQ